MLKEDVVHNKHNNDHNFHFLIQIHYYNLLMMAKDDDLNQDLLHLHHWNEYH
jgi:hypothetical protein